MQKTQFENPKMQTKALAEMKKVNQPVSVDFIAHHLDLNWATARALLLNLALEGRVKALKTTKSFVFMLPEDKAETVPA